MEHWIMELVSQLPIIGLFIIILFTLATLSKGADMLVDEAVTLSVRWGIPKVVIGATIVSLGTTLPEATVSVAAAMGGNPDIAVGNAIGSVICDSSLIIGIASMIRPLPVHRSTTDRQSWLQLGAGLLLVLVALPWSHLSELFYIEGRIPQWIGMVFLVLLLIYLYLTFKRAKSGTLDSVDIDHEASEQDKAAMPYVIMKLAIGLGLIIVSSKVLLPTIEETARRVGIPQSIIAATLVAFGTSLPELITAIQASRKGHGELAVGNVIGADILNILFVIGAAAAVTPEGLVVPPYFFWFHIPFMLLILIVFKLFLTLGRPLIGRREGGVMFLLYIAYTVLGYILI